MNQFFRYWFPVIAYCTIIFVQSSYSSPDTLPRFAYADKTMHFIAYGLLGALFCRAFNSVPRWRYRWDVLFFMGVAAATLYGVSDEWHQSFVAERTGEMGDLVADFMGSMAGSWLYLRFLRLRRKNRSS
jgi:VanZ family protein